LEHGVYIFYCCRAVNDDIPPTAMHAN